MIIKVNNMVLTGDNFKEFITSDSLTLVDFWAPWCAPCRMLLPILEEIENESDVSLGKVNVDEEEAIALAFGIQNIPTLMVFKNGKILGKKVGFLPKKAIMDWLNSLK